MRDGQEMQPIADILLRVARELDHMAVLVDTLHVLLEIVDKESLSQRQAFIGAAQSIDIVEQRLSGLSHYVSELAELTPGKWGIEGRAAAKKLKLAELAARLSDHVVEPSTLMSGELETF